MTGAPFGRIDAERIVLFGGLNSESTVVGGKYAACDLTFLVGCHDMGLSIDRCTHMQLNFPDAVNSRSAVLQPCIIAHGEPRLSVGIILVACWVSSVHGRSMF